MNPEDILQSLATATQNFLGGEKELLALDVNERSLTHKLAELIQKQFPEWHVDCEYNRLMDAVKRLPRATETSSADTDGQTIYPDIIVHRRGTTDNLLVVEVKKSTNNKPGDEVKLRALTSSDGEYQYELGVHLIFNCNAATVEKVTCYAQGAANDALTKAAEPLFSAKP